MLSRRDILLLGLLFVVSLPAVTARLYSSDEVEYFAYLRSLWFDHDVSFENEYRYFYDHGIAQTPDFHQTFLELETPTGRRINYGTIGCAMLWAPFYGVARCDCPWHARNRRTHRRRWLLETLYRGGRVRIGVLRLHDDRAGHGGRPPYRRQTRAQLGTCGVAGYPTPLLYVRRPAVLHACSAFAVALFVTVWLKARQQWTVGGAVALGLTGALMAMVREQDLFVALGPAIDFALAVIKEKGKGKREKA